MILREGRELMNRYAFDDSIIMCVKTVLCIKLEPNRRKTKQKRLSILKLHVSTFQNILAQPLYFRSAPLILLSFFLFCIQDFCSQNIFNFSYEKKGAE